MNRDDDVRELFESVREKSSPEDRDAIVRAAAPILTEHVARWERERAAASPRRFLSPRTLALTAAAAVVLGLVLFARPPATRETRSAPLRSWAEHVQPGRPFPLAAASFERAY